VEWPEKESDPEVCVMLLFLLANQVEPVAEGLSGTQKKAGQGRLHGRR